MTSELFWYSLLVTAICSVLTIFIRLMPIMFFRKKNLPKWVTYIGDVLPFAIMPILVMYCIQGTKWTEVGSVVPTLCGVGITALVHLWRKNTILSLIIGLATYMILLHVL